MEISIPFDGDVGTTQDAAKDLDITLDGDSLDTRTTQVVCAADGTELRITLSPTPQAQGIDSGLYFACYQGKLSVRPAAGDGALPDVVAQDGSAAVMDGALELTIPSGMQLETTASKLGQTKVRVVRSAQIRCCTWVRIGDEQLFMHHHTFYRESERTCAQALAEAVNNSLDGNYTASCDKDTVTVEAQGAGASERFDVEIVEGVGV